MDISDLNEYDLIRDLWKNQKIAAFFSQFHFLETPQLPSDMEIEKQKWNNSYDYVNGRAIKLNLNYPSGRLYDRKAGQGTFDRVLQELREKKNNKQ